MVQPALFPMVVDVSPGPGLPCTITTTGAPAGRVFELVRMRNGYAWPGERVPGQHIADANGGVVVKDFLFPVDEDFAYALYDTYTSTLTSYEYPARWLNIPSNGVPWISDAVLPEKYNFNCTIIDDVNRVYPARVSQYAVVGQRFAITAGDVRSGWSGTLRLFAYNVGRPDAWIEAMSTGNPCLLRLPYSCKYRWLHEMYFTPLDINESRWGSQGRGYILDVDYVTVDIGDSAAYQTVTYALQTDNADAATMDYADLALNFAGRSYADLYLSQTGTAP